MKLEGGNERMIEKGKGLHTTVIGSKMGEEVAVEGD